MVGKEIICPNCGGDLKYYDKVRRISLTKFRESRHIQIRRFRCVSCGAMHREITDDIFPYKHYEAEIIRGVLEGFITADTLGFEDFPCETTMLRWKSQNSLELFLHSGISNLD